MLCYVLCFIYFLFIGSMNTLILSYFLVLSYEFSIFLKHSLMEKLQIIELGIRTEKNKKGKG